METTWRTLTIRVCRWLESDEYQELVKTFKYLGRERGCSIFYSPLPRLLREFSSVEELLDYLSKFDAILDPRDLEFLKNAFEEYNSIHITHVPRKGFLLKSQARLAEYMEKFREQVGGQVRYAHEYQGFIVRPPYVMELIEYLRQAGFKIKIETPLLTPSKLQHNLELKVKLRDYQAEALDAWRRNRYRGVIALPTGSGKTVVALAAICELKVPTLIVVYTRDQINEWKSKILELTNIPPSLIGLFYGEEKQVKPITIATYQTAYRNTDILTDKFSLLVVDEVHHLPADKFRAIALEVLAPFRMGLSATPYREDGREKELFSLMGELVYTKSLDELIARGYVAPFYIIPYYVELKPDERLEYERLAREYARLSRGLDLENIIALAREGNEFAKKALNILTRMRMMIALSKSKIEAAKSIVTRELQQGSKVLIFTHYVNQAELVGKQLGVPVLTGRLDKSKRRLLLEAFRRGSLRVLVLTTLGDEGIDLPDANVGIVLSLTRSRRQLVQRLGRLLRPQPGKVAKLYVVICRGTIEERAWKSLRGSLPI